MINKYQEIFCISLITIIIIIFHKKKKTIAPNANQEGILKSSGLLAFWQISCSFQNSMRYANGSFYRVLVPRVTRFTLRMQFLYASTLDRRYCAHGAAAREIPEGNVNIIFYQTSYFFGRGACSFMNIAL